MSAIILPKLPLCALNLTFNHYSIKETSQFSG